ncbi:MAG: hypothetical protein OXE97_00555 [Gammaproteobacteria bacterium]|nr:hypothetical protein [Gammaproteobacteria bacterium]MCY4283202.1 hypothetical protein [Gammaproteobacteria bacterium]
MSSTALYRAFIDAGASEEKATLAAEDVVQVSQLPQLATKSNSSDTAKKADGSDLEVRRAKMEIRLIKWIVGSGLLNTSIIIAAILLLR